MVLPVVFMIHKPSTDPETASGLARANDLMINPWHSCC
jgi:hypothetical protein